MSNTTHSYSTHLPSLGAEWPTHTRKNDHTYTHTHARTHAHTHTLSHTGTHTRTHTHTHTHTHKLSLSLSLTHTHILTIHMCYMDNFWAAIQSHVYLQSYECLTIILHHKREDSSSTHLTEMTTHCNTLQHNAAHCQTHW